jgi:hypothetical protein
MQGWHGAWKGGGGDWVFLGFRVELLAQVLPRPQLIFGYLLEFSAAEITSKSSHILNPNLTK